MAECMNVKESKTPTSVIYNNNNFKSHKMFLVMLYIMDSSTTKTQIIMHLNRMNMYEFMHQNLPCILLKL